MSYKSVVDWIVDRLSYTMIRVASLVGALPAAVTLLDSIGYTVYGWVLVICIELMGFGLGTIVVAYYSRRRLSLRQTFVIMGMYGIVIEGLLLGHTIIPSWVLYWAGGRSLGEAIANSVAFLMPAFTLASAALLTFWDQLRKEETVENRTVEDALSKEAFSLELEREREQKLWEQQQERERIAWEDERKFKLKEQEIKLSKKLGTAKTVAGTVATVAETVAETVALQSENYSNSSTVADRSAGVNYSETTVATVLAATGGRNSELDEALQFVKGHPNCKAKELGDYLKLHKTTAIRKLRFLVAEGKVVEILDGQSYRYRLADDYNTEEG